LIELGLVELPMLPHEVAAAASSEQNDSTLADEAALLA